MSLNLFLELSRELFCIRKSDGYFEPLNSAWENVLGWTRSELHSRSWIEFVHPDDVQSSLNAETQCTQEDVVEYKNRYRHKNGNYCWLSWRMTRHEDGSVYAVAQNLIGEKDVEKALHNRLALERLVTSLSTKFINLSLEEIDSGINHALQDIGKFSGFDRSYVALFSEDGSEINLVYEWPTESAESALSKHPRFSSATFSWWVTKLRNFEVIQVSSICELPPEADTTRQVMELMGTKSIVAVPMVQGKSAIGFIGFSAVKEKKVFSDEIVTLLRIVGEILTNALSRKQSQEQLRQSEEQLRLALDAANMGFWAWNIQTGTVTWSDNFKRIFGLPLDLEEGSYELFLSIVHPEDRDRVHQASLNSFETGESGNIDYRIVWPDGSIHWIESLFQFFFDETGKPIRKTGLDLDVSDRKLAELQLQESLREKEILLQEIHHRVKNNLQVICSLLDLQSQYINEPAMQEMFRESYNRVKSMALVHEKLYQSKNFAKINFAEYISSLINDLFYAYRLKANYISLELDIDEIALNIDTTISCGLIINELVSNALKHAFADNQEGKIHVAIHTEDRRNFTLIVSDTGRGFSQEFDFNTTKTLGLQLVKLLTNQLEGTLEIDCRNGTEFRISI